MEKLANGITGKVALKSLKLLGIKHEKLEITGRPRNPGKRQRKPGNKTTISLY